MIIYFKNKKRKKLLNTHIKTILLFIVIIIIGYFIIKYLIYNLKIFSF